MKTSLIGIASLAPLAALMNINWLAGQTMSAPHPGDACKTELSLAMTVSRSTFDEVALGGVVLAPGLLAGGCEGCPVAEQVTQYYCESRGTDCDGLWGTDESYKWRRTKTVYECGTPGQPGYGFFVECTDWVPDNCCDDGGEGALPECSHAGASPCSMRNPGAP